MPRFRRNSTPMLSLAVLLAAVATAPAAAADSPCYAEWSDAAPIVARERLRAALDIQILARRELSGDLIRITLCREDSRFVYRLLMRDLKGRISNFTIDARQPMPR